MSADKIHAHAQELHKAILHAHDIAKQHHEMVKAHNLATGKGPLAPKDNRMQSVKDLGVKK
jgi:hypothetical protein